MGSISTPKLPLIGLSELDGSKPRTGRWDSLQSQVREALEELGCFEALTDKMTLELHNDAFQELEVLLELPTDVKHWFNVPDKPETMNTYVTRVSELDSLMKKLVLGSLSVEKYVESLVKSVRYNFRVVRYATPGTEESKKPRALCHRDPNSVAMLHQNHVTDWKCRVRMDVGLRSPLLQLHLSLSLLGSHFT
ncbi:probable 2-oxoglutarate-dependent dioxygenase AOP1.2 [Eucalyptus grandis]|uniref:probable 2-oxoglutarate-dependent dioxygenase AOP1.2 n=1 Tax=Eucalyptus grandis TaxID=71139 RepID=UPI0008A0A81A|nr:probable 2-oxoglutarate-dependent dioxygenase AOP1.2 [Eucalyptus grandis]